MTLAAPGNDGDNVASIVYAAWPWCRVGTTTAVGSGWCPAIADAPLTGTMAALEILDLSNNGLAGGWPHTSAWRLDALRSVAAIPRASKIK